MRGATLPVEVTRRGSPEGVRVRDRAERRPSAELWQRHRPAPLVADLARKRGRAVTLRFVAQLPEQAVWRELLSGGGVEGIEPSGDRPLSCDNVTSRPPLCCRPGPKAGSSGSQAIGGSVVENARRGGP